MILRKLTKIGGSTYVLIPHDWIEYHEKNTGKPLEEVLMEVNKDIILRIDETNKNNS